MLSSVLIANRGEIAVRVVRTCAELGIKSVAVFSDADERAMHVRLADQAVHLPGCTVEETYLDADRIVAAAIGSGARAVHPGYGFLSENAGFADLVAHAGLTFIGPSGEAIRLLGDKGSARRLAAAEGLPVIPGIELTDSPGSRLVRFGERHGWPVLLKPGRGGGGAGMVLVHSPAEVEEQLDRARRAAGADGTVLAERYLPNARHVEVQLLFDGHGHSAQLGDRDCSVQRRRQKLVEECPAPGLDQQLRERLRDAALRLGRRVGYVGVGTVEFLVEGADFYFLEVNPRLQVEHTVTEAVYGIDLVREQLLIAGGEPLSRDVLEPRGHAFECRVNAEDPARGFLPTPGTLEALVVPCRPGLRVDTGYEAGDVVTTNYDSLVAKLIVWGSTRDVALHRLQTVLADCEVRGTPTTLPALAAIARHPDFAAGAVPITWLETVVGPELRTDTAHGFGRHPQHRDVPGVWISGRFHRIPDAARDGPPRSAQRDLPRRPGTAASRAAAPEGRQSIGSPITGTVTAVTACTGQTVTAGQILGIVEAMKMEHPLITPATGLVRALTAPGQLVTAGQELFIIEPLNGTATATATRTGWPTDAAS